ncbi:hypothetical protein Pyrde_0710 [Pyrodictium delaneyi]|uniref:Uncharacterized protein n=1 Tax=Pyrodictium delaneyi TaxID=1273541 RepID=A0A0P0N2B2_9CREN|nr:hypothetical protein [Pyrodictium delaneyi]ALL00760.1 hypothetical protein Pyrde_0710 [Pyrodictium delaneyi]
MAGKHDRQRRRIEPRELLRRRGVITETEVAEWLREGRLYVYRDERGEPVAFYAAPELLHGEPWWVLDRRLEERRRRLLEQLRREQRRDSGGAGDAREEPAGKLAGTG